MPRRLRGQKEAPAKAKVAGIRPVNPRYFVSCPLCCMSRKLDRTGSWAKAQRKYDTTEPPKGRSRFGRFDLDDGRLIQIRNCSGSRGSGFPVIGGYTIEEMKAMPEFAEVLEELKQAARNLLAKLGKE